jgi:hypothetical protein
MIIQINQKGDEVQRFLFGLYEYETNYQEGNTNYDFSDQLELRFIGMANLNCFGYTNPMEVFEKWRLKFQREETKKAGVPQIVKIMDKEEFDIHYLHEIMSEEDC